MDKEMCLGSYCFLWGQKQESTATWHGMYLSNGNPTEAVDVMHYCWKGNWPDKRAPSIKNIYLNGINWKKDHFISKDSIVNLNFEFEQYNNKVIEIDYVLYPEAFSNKMGGDFQESPDPIHLDIIKRNSNQILFKSPSKKGAYRIFTFIKNEFGQSSVANIPFLVN